MELLQLEDFKGKFLRVDGHFLENTLQGFRLLRWSQRGKGSPEVLKGSLQKFRVELPDRGFIDLSLDLIQLYLQRIPIYLEGTYLCFESPDGELSLSQFPSVGS